MRNFQVYLVAKLNVMLINVGLPQLQCCYLAHKRVFENREERQHTVKTELEKLKTKWRGRLRRADGFRALARGASYSQKTLKERDGQRGETLTTHQHFLSTASEMQRGESGGVLTAITNTVPCQLTSQLRATTADTLDPSPHQICYHFLLCFIENIMLLRVNLKMCRILSCVGFAAGKKNHAFFNIVSAFIPLVYTAIYRQLLPAQQRQTECRRCLAKQQSK